MKQRPANVLVTLLALAIVSVGLANSLGVSRERGEWAAAPAPLEFGVWHSSKGYTGFEDCMDQHQTAKILAGSESNEEVKEWCRMATSSSR